MTAKKPAKPSKSKASPHTQKNLALAKDPSTSGALLEKLSRSTNDLVRRAVAENPNTPTQTLLELSNTHFHAFARNPGLPLLVLAEPEFLSKIPERASIQLTYIKDLPEAIAIALAKAPSAYIRAHIANHPSLPTESVAALLFDIDPTVRTNARCNPNVRERDLKDLDMLQPDNAGNLIGPSNLSQETLWRIASYSLWGKYLVAGCADASPELLALLFQQLEELNHRSQPSREWNLHSIKVKVKLSRRLEAHPNLPLHILEGALHSEHPETRISAALNKRVSFEQALPVIHTADGRDVLIFLLRPEISEELFSSIIKRARDTDALWSIVWEHPMLGPEHLELLSTSSSKYARWGVADHPLTSNEVLGRLSEDEDIEVRELAKKSLRDRAQGTNRAR